MIDCSYGLLTLEERSLWCRLSMFVGRFDLEAVECVERVDEYQTFQLLAGLVDRSVVQVDHADPAARYRLLESIRE